MIDTQLELGFGKARQRFARTQRQQRVNRAHWWFQRMRHVVDRAFDWETVPAARPEQIWLENGRR